jgi:hypothetical protein
MSGQWTTSKTALQLRAGARNDQQAPCMVNRLPGLNPFGEVIRPLSGGLIVCGEVNWRPDADISEIGRRRTDEQGAYVINAISGGCSRHAARSRSCPGRWAMAAPLFGAVRKRRTAPFDA